MHMNRFNPVTKFYLYINLSKLICLKKNTLGNALELNTICVKRCKRINIIVGMGISGKCFTNGSTSAGLPKSTVTYILI